MCGYPQQGDQSLVIYDRGCLRAGEEWIESNLVPVAGVAVGVAVLQVGPGEPQRIMYLLEPIIPQPHLNCTVYILI